jgi:hypothetical protein
MKGREAGRGIFKMRRGKRSLEVQLGLYIFLIPVQVYTDLRVCFVRCPYRISSPFWFTDLNSDQMPHRLLFFNELRYFALLEEALKSVIL